MAKKSVALKCSVRRIQVQNDLRDWELDAQNKPIKVVNEKYWTLKNVSVDARDIPKTKIILAKSDDVDKKIKEVTDIEKDKRTKP